PSNAPTHVNLRHQIPNNNTGQNVDAANANANPTVCTRSSYGSTTAAVAANPATPNTAMRKSLVLFHNRSVAIVPATLTNNPDDADTNAAKAPAASTATTT